MSDGITITLREAAKLAGILPQTVAADTSEHTRPANQPGAEANAALETMLAASRKGKRIG